MSSALHAPPHVLITGGAVRLGAVLCSTFARAGWKVWCHYQRSADEAHALQERLAAEGHTVEPVQADLAEATQRADLIARLQAAHGPLQAVVNNASLFEPDTGDDFTAPLTRRQLEVNLVAPLDLARRMAATHPDDAPAGSCVAIHILDQKVYNLNPDYFSYTVSKLALERAVSLQAQALAPRARICGVAPGLMLVSGPQSEANFAAARQANLMRRPLDPADVARACLFLAENPAITGSTLCVDNGQHLLPLPRDIMFVVDDLLQSHLSHHDLPPKLD